MSRGEVTHSIVTRRVRRVMVILWVVSGWMNIKMKQRVDVFLKKNRSCRSKGHEDSSWYKRISRPIHFATARIRSILCLAHLNGT